MGFKYSPCNEELDRVYQDAMNKPADHAVSAPWMRGKSLVGLGRLGLIAAHDAGAGLAKSGRDYKLYYSRGFAGWWSFEVWGLAKTAFWGALWMTVLYLVMEQYFVGHWVSTYASDSPIRVPMNGSVPYKTFFLGVVGLLVFGVRGLFFQRHTKIALASGTHGDIAAACINFAILVLSVAAIIKGFSTIGVTSASAGKGGVFDVTESSLLGALLSMPVDFVVQIGSFFSQGVLFGLAAIAAILAVIPACVALAAWIVMWCGFWPMAAKIWNREILSACGNGVVADLYRNSGLPELAEMKEPGVLLALGTYSVILLTGFITLVK